MNIRRAAVAGRPFLSERVSRAAFFASIVACLVAIEAKAATEAPAVEIPTGQAITPTAANGALFQELNPTDPAMPDSSPGWAVAVAASPDGSTLAILTSGYNRYTYTDHAHENESIPRTAEISAESVLLLDITQRRPRPLQVLPLPNAFQGLAWTPGSDRLFAAGGKDDIVAEFVRTGSSMFARGRTFRLGHQTCTGLDNTNAAYPFLGRCAPVAGALAVSPDGTRLLVANLENDSVSLIDLRTGQLSAEQDLRPGIIDPRRHGEAGGSFPRALVWVSTDRAYVASERDREVIALQISRAKIRVVRRIAVPGQPVALLANRSGTRLYAALSSSAKVAVLETSRNRLLEQLDATAPSVIYPNPRQLGGASPNALALTPDQRTLLVSNGGENALAVLRLSDQAAGLVSTRSSDSDGDEDDDESPTDRNSTVIGLVPTGWYPTGVAISGDGGTWYIINGKSPSGENGIDCPERHESRLPCVGRGAVRSRELIAGNDYVLQLEKAGLLTMPAPPPVELARLTRQVARNNHFDRPDLSEADQRLFEFLHGHIKHVIYIIKENRSYDQVLGDLEVGNGDPHLTLFPRAISPNHHALARNFVTLDNFLVSGEVSWSGWDWAVSAQTSDFREHQEPMTTAHRGLEGEPTGFNRNINMGYATSAERHAARSVYPADPDILPGERDVTAPDGPGGVEGSGYLWDAALRAGLTLRNWGFFGENPAYNASDTTLVREPFLERRRVFFPTKSVLAPYSDPYYLDFAPNFPDFWRTKEWQREFSQFTLENPAPQLMLVRLGNDHFGAFDRAIDGVNTPETQMADNDYALGLIVEAVARSPFAKDTLVVSIEDDACDGPDHVDAHRSIALVAGPYVRERAVVSTRYTTVSVVKTIETILGIAPIGLNDALAAPMSDIFDPEAAANWSYTAVVPDVLRSTRLPLPPGSASHVSFPRHSAAYWAKAMAGQDFSGADRIDPIAFNRALWRGLKGQVTPPGQHGPRSQ